MTTTDLVQIETLSIEAKVIVIGKKEVTLSVFRQLKCESIFTESEELSGVPWGIVNYTWKEEKKWGRDLWIGSYLVWQGGGELFRMPIPEIDGDDYKSESWIEFMRWLKNQIKLSIGLGVIYRDWEMFVYNRMVDFTYLDQLFIAV